LPRTVWHSALVYVIPTGIIIFKWLWNFLGSLIGNVYADGEMQTNLNESIKKASTGTDLPSGRSEVQLAKVNAFFVHHNLHEAVSTHPLKTRKVE
jgi:hypothetical protein